MKYAMTQTTPLLTSSRINLSYELISTLESPPLLSSTYNHSSNLNTRKFPSPLSPSQAHFQNEKRILSSSILHPLPISYEPHPSSPNSPPTPKIKAPTRDESIASSPTYRFRSSIAYTAITTVAAAVDARPHKS